MVGAEKPKRRVITRFAPSPTGPLHLGHAYSALLNWDAAQAANGTFLLRIEDTDSTRARPEFEAQIYDDLAWLGLTWPTPRRQSDHYDDYWRALKVLAGQGLIFPCSCNRRTISAAGLGLGPDGPVYHGACAARLMESAKPTDALRLNLQKAALRLPETLTYVDNGVVVSLHPKDLTATVGAPILRRIKTGDPAYHLACTCDDALQRVTHVIRGQDVAPLTPIHVILQNLMGWPSPDYHHHGLITDDKGERLAKITKSRALATYRDAGATPADIRAMVGL